MSIKQQAASSAILQRDGRFLLVRRKNPPSADMYAFPGGRAELGETPDQTALREFLEETGLTVFNPRLFSTYDLEHRDDNGEIKSHFFLSVFLVEERGSANPVAADDAESFGWFTASEVLSLNAPDSVKDCVLRLMQQSAESLD